MSKQADRVNKSLTVLVKGKNYEIKFVEKEFQTLNSDFMNSKICELSSKTDTPSNMIEKEDVCKVNLQDTSSLVSPGNEFDQDKSNSNRNEKLVMDGDFSVLAAINPDSNDTKEDQINGEVKSIDTVIPESLPSNSFPNEDSNLVRFEVEENIEIQWNLRDQFADIGDSDNISTVEEFDSDNAFETNATKQLNEGTLNNEIIDSAQGSLCKIIYGA